MPRLAEMLASAQIPVPPVSLPKSASRRAPLVLLAQEQQQWCWASVMQGFISELPQMRHRKSRYVAQRHIVADVLGIERFWGPPPPAANVPHDLRKILRKLRWIRSWHVGHPTPWLVKQLSGSDYLLCWIRWSSRNLHYVVVNGFTDVPGGLLVHVSDPEPNGNDLIMPYRTLCRAYRSGKGSVVLYAKVW